MMKLLKGWDLLVLGMIFVCGACGSLQQATGNSRIYDKSFDKVDGLVREGVENTKLVITNTLKSNDESVITYHVVQGSSGGGSSGSTVGSQHVNQERGTITVSKLANGKIKLSVENPDYNFALPNHQREDYEHILLEAFDKVMGRPQRE